MTFGFVSSLVKYKSFRNFGIESSIYQNIRNFFRVLLFSFFELEKFFKSFFWKSSISRNIRKTFFKKIEDLC